MTNKKKYPKGTFILLVPIMVWSDLISYIVDDFISNQVLHVFHTMKKKEIVSCPFYSYLYGFIWDLPCSTSHIRKLVTRYLSQL